MVEFLQALLSFLGLVSRVASQQEFRLRCVVSWFSSSDKRFILCIVTPVFIIVRTLTTQRNSLDGF